MGKYINDGSPVYFTYARNGNSEGCEHIADCVEDLIVLFESEKIQYSIDQEDITNGNSISDYEREIGNKSKYVVLVYSDKYFRSRHCMYEFVNVKKSKKQQVFYIKSGDFNLSDSNYISELKKYWLDKQTEYNRNMNLYGNKPSAVDKSMSDNNFYLDEISTLSQYFSDKHYVTANSLKNDNYKVFLHQIKKVIAPNPTTKILKFSLLIALVIAMCVVCWLWYDAQQNAIHISNVAFYDENDEPITGIVYIDKISALTVGFEYECQKEQEMVFKYFAPNSKDYDIRSEELIEVTPPKFKEVFTETDSNNFVSPGYYMCQFWKDDEMIYEKELELYNSYGQIGRIFNMKFTPQGTKLNVKCDVEISNAMNEECTVELHVCIFLPIINQYFPYPLDTFDGGFKTITPKRSVKPTKKRETFSDIKFTLDATDFKLYYDNNKPVYFDIEVHYNNGSPYDSDDKSLITKTRHYLFMNYIPTL